ncbi:MAG: nucleoside kinase [Chloroflexi bacterium]|nr:nucleoside kinase [Ardenticatenaceae bacterium]MBL1130860.1 nucleoside kinase [Chloroflexota bacterium]NOG36958.1 nucleoside kinase [Chloroflexota bacterium]GIK54517.1 MAG: uridine kinase [Chloroflexota bacterium]
MTTPIPTTPRQTIQARFPDGRAFEAPVGTPIEAFVQAAKLEQPGNGRVVAVLMNHRLRELSIPLQTDADLVPITTADSDGSRIYRRSLTFLMVVAAAELFPAYTITIMHSMPFGGYYCEFDGVRATQIDLDALKNRMRQLVEADLPINQVRVPLDEALQLFRDWGDEEKAQLFAKRRKDYLTLYELNGERDYFHGFMAPRTGYLELFDLRPYNNGFILQFPRRHQPDVLQQFEDEPVLARVFQEYAQWLALIGVPKVAALNETLTNGRILQAILVSEALHQRQLNRIANEIAERRSDEQHTAVRRSSVRIVLISGPTSAGKTTFSKRLAIQLLARGIHPVTIGMDNYFVNREDTPRDETGAYDFESLEAVDVAFFQHQMRQLLQGETIIQPRFNFHTGRREEGEPLTIGPEHIILIEGIHGLNPRLVQNVPPEAIYRIFISAFTQLNLDKHNRIPTTDTRLLRRIVRDATHRGYTAADTIGRWPSVRRGEKRHIFPYQSNADVFFNSALVYELAALKPFAEPLLLQVEPDAPERIEANRLRAFLQWFDPLSPDQRAHIPGDSILREFIGGSLLEHYEPGLLL